MNGRLDSADRSAWAGRWRCHLPLLDDVAVLTKVALRGATQAAELDGAARSGRHEDK